MRDVLRLLRPADPGLALRLEELDRTPAKELRRRHGPEVARFVSQPLEVVKRAAGRFPEGRIACGTSRGLEQATSHAVARHRARRFAEATPGNDSLAWDACAGIGSDAMALADEGLTVLATDVSEETLGYTVINDAVINDAVGADRSRGTVMVCAADAARPALDPGVRARTLGLFDPDRRDPHGRRLGDPEDWSPSLGDTLGTLAGLRGGCVKLAPGIDPDLIRRALPKGVPASLEWISLDGELKELALWTGALAKTEQPVGATLLRTGSGGTTLTGASFPEAGPLEPLPDPGEAQGWWLVEIAPALALSRLGDRALASIRAHALDPADPGSFALAPPGPDPSGPGIRAWRVLGAVPADLKRLRRALRDAGIGTVTVKTRGQGVPEAGGLAERLKGPGHGEGLLAITTWYGAARRAARVGLMLEEVPGEGA